VTRASPMCRTTVTFSGSDGTSLLLEEAMVAVCRGARDVVEVL